MLIRILTESQVTTKYPNQSRKYSKKNVKALLLGLLAEISQISKGQIMFSC